MSKSAKIAHSQKMFLKAMRAKFAEEHPIESPEQLQNWHGMPPVLADCPNCKGHGYRKGAFCHRCGSTGKIRVNQETQKVKS